MPLNTNSLQGTLKQSPDLFLERCRLWLLHKKATRTFFTFLISARCLVPVFSEVLSEYLGLDQLAQVDSGSSQACISSNRMPKIPKWKIAERRWSANQTRHWKLHQTRELLTYQLEPIPYQIATGIDRPLHAFGWSYRKVVDCLNILWASENSSNFAHLLTNKHEYISGITWRTT